MPTTPAEGPSTSPRNRRKPSLTNSNINITPEYLLFPPPHQGRAIQNVISVYNTDDAPCVYKLRTQNPNRYVAKPNVAVVAAKSATRIKVTLCVAAGEGDIPADTEERFRVSVKRLKKIPGDVPPKELWNSAKEPIVYEKDIMAVFRADVATPAGGMVSFLPEKYVTAVVSARGSATNSLAKQRPSQSNHSHTEPTSKLRATASADSPTTPSKGETECLTASRPLARDLDNAASDTVSAHPDKRKKPRTWKTFVVAAAVAVVLAYGVGLSARLLSNTEKDSDNGVRSSPTPATNPLRGSQEGGTATHGVHAASDHNLPPQVALSVGTSRQLSDEPDAPAPAEGTPERPNTPEQSDSAKLQHEERGTVPGEQGGESPVEADPHDIHHETQGENSESVPREPPQQDLSYEAHRAHQE